MNNELIERIDAVLELWQGVTVLPDDIYLLQDCKAALTRKESSIALLEQRICDYLYGRCVCPPMDGDVDRVEHYPGCPVINKQKIEALTQQQEAEPVGWFTEDHTEDKSATTYDPEVAERWRAKGWPVTALYLHPPKPAALPQVPDAGMTVGTRYEYTKIGSAEQKWWGCVLAGFDGGQPIIRTDAGHYHLRPLTEYRFRAISAAKEGGK